MMKRWISCLLIATVILSCFSLCVFAEEASGTFAPDFSWNLDLQTGELNISGSGAMNQNPWSEYSDQIKSVTIAPGVTRIGERAFEECSNLSSVTLPEGLEVIGASAFYLCPALTSVVIPEGVQTIGDTAFYGCNLNSIYLPHTLSWISIYTLPATLRTIYYNGTPAEWNKIIINEQGWNLSSATINFNVSDKCGDELRWSFDEKTGVLTISGSGDMYDFEPHCMPWEGICSKIRDLEFDGEITYIGEFAFVGVASPMLILPDGLKKIANGAFDGLYADFIYIPDSVTAIPDGAFAGCFPPFSVFYGGTQTQWEALLGVRYNDALEYATLYCNATITFFDAYPQQWYYPGLEYAYRSGLMVGTAKGKISPNVTTTRSMIVSILYRLSGAEKPTGGNPFTDVKAGQWYTDAVLWAAENEIVSGYGNGKFGPNDPITREQIAVILKNYAEKSGADVSKTAALDSFPDAAKVGSWAKGAVSWAVAEGLISGSVSGGKTLLDPQGKATRAMIASIMMRFVEKSA